MMGKVMEWFSGSLVKDVLGGLDGLITSKEERMQAEIALKQIFATKELELQKMQADIIIAEASGNWLQRSWRPILMLSFGFIVIYVKFLGPLFGLTIPPLEDEFWNLLQLGWTVSLQTNVEEKIEINFLSLQLNKIKLNGKVKRKRIN